MVGIALPACHLNVGWNWRCLKRDKLQGLAAGPAQSPEIRLHFDIYLERFQCGIENGCCSGIFGALHTVVHPFPFATCGYDTGASQIGEMSRYLRLALLQDFDKITDTDLAAVHEIEQPEPRGIGQSGKHASEVK